MFMIREKERKKERKIERKKERKKKQERKGDREREAHQSPTSLAIAVAASRRSFLAPVIPLHYSVCSERLEFGAWATAAATIPEISR